MHMNMMRSLSESPVRIILWSIVNFLILISSSPPSKFSMFFSLNDDFVPYNNDGWVHLKCMFALYDFILFYFIRECEQMNIE